jgi:hypothetical protein
VFPATDVGGSGLTIGGSSNPQAPVAQYVDYLDVDGALIASANGAPPQGWYYQRVWQVTSPKANLKQVTVTATVRFTSGAYAVRPRATVTSLKTSPF